MSDLAAELAALQSRPEPPVGAEEVIPAAAPPVAAAPAVAPIAAPAAVSAAPSVATPSVAPGAPAAPFGSAPPNAPAPVDPNAPPLVVDPNAPPQVQLTFASVEEAANAFRDQQGRAATERAARRTAERAAQEAAAQIHHLQQQQQLMTQNFQMLMARIMAQGGMPGAPGAPQQQQPQQPQLRQLTLEELERDPIAALRMMAGGYNAMLQERADIDRTTAERARQAEENNRVVQLQTQQVQAIATNLRDYEAEYSVAQPDYQDAAKYYVEARKRQLATMYPGFDEDRLTAAITHEVLNSAAQAMRTGANPAQLLYQAATHMGYTYRPPAPAAAPAAAPLNPAAAASAALAAVTAPNAANPLAHVQAGLAAATSLSAGGGGAPAGDGMSLEAGLGLTGAAFESWQEKFLEQMTGRRSA